MPAVLISRKSVDGLVPIPHALTVELTAKDLAGGTTIDLTYSVRGNANVKLDSADERPGQAVGTKNTIIAHTLTLVRAQAKVAPKGQFVIEAVAREGDVERFRTTWTVRLAPAGKSAQTFALGPAMDTYAADAVMGHANVSRSTRPLRRALIKRRRR
ncbi:hypothetical protein [Gemmatimonas sp.]|uniref:hypothetical protein n=1 Tax=Gemmatimonas sp. TaxID=1962908 RepID=UPI003F718E41